MIEFFTEIWNDPYSKGLIVGAILSSTIGLIIDLIKNKKTQDEENN